MLRLKRFVPNTLRFSNNLVLIPKYLSNRAFEFDIGNPISVDELNTSSVPKVLPKIEVTDTRVVDIGLGTSQIAINKTSFLERKKPWRELFDKYTPKGFIVVHVLGFAYIFYSASPTTPIVQNIVGCLGILAFTGVTIMHCEEATVERFFDDVYRIRRDYYKPKYSEEYDKPILVIDDWTDQAPYLRILTWLKNRSHNVFISTASNTDIPWEKNRERLYNIKQFVENSKGIPGYVPLEKRNEIFNIPYLKYLSLAERTYLIDWFVEKNYENGAIVSSVNYDLDKLYDESRGACKVLPIEGLHPKYTGECYLGKKIIEDNLTYGIGTRTQSVKVFEENTIDKTKSRVIFVDSFDEYFNLKDITNNNIYKKLQSFGKHNIIAVDNKFSAVRHFTDKVRQQAIYMHKDVVKEMLYIKGNMSYFSCCVDSMAIEFSAQDQDHETTYIAFVDEHLEKLYKGTFPIVKLDIEINKVDYYNIKVLDTKAFSKGYKYAMTGDSEYDLYDCYLDKNDFTYANEWGLGYMYYKIHYKNTHCGGHV